MNPLRLVHALPSILPPIPAPLIPLTLALSFGGPGRAQDQLFIEAEDFNFDGGQFIDNPVLEPGDNSYEGKGAVLGVPRVDFQENSPTIRLGNESTEGYRAPAPGGSAGLPQTVLSDDDPGRGISEYELGATEPGEWLHYTRTFPPGDYSVTARVRDVGADPFVARLERVTGDPTAPGQPATAVGVFLGRNAGPEFGDLPMTDVGENPVIVHLDGEETLRLSTQTGSYHLNYLLFEMVDDGDEMPVIDIVSPGLESGIAPGSDLEVIAEVADAGSVAAVQFLAIESSNGSETTIGEVTAAPFSVVWAGVPEGSFHVIAVVAATDGLIGISSAVVVHADDTPPVVDQVRGLTTERVGVSFSEPMNPDTAGDSDNYSIQGPEGPLAITGLAVSLDGRVTISTATQTVGTEYTLAMNNLADLAGNPLGDGVEETFFGNGPLLQTELGFVVFETEHFDRNLDGLWVEDTTRGNPSGGVSMVNPNGAGGSEDETKLEYDINFVKTGTHYFWYRASSDNGNDDSAWLHLDGARPPERTDANTASMSGFSTQADFVWSSTAQDGGGPMTFDITSTGLHTISIARREDGAYFDKFVITTDPNYDPATEGEFGPPLTPREGEPPRVGEVEITAHPEDVTGEEHSAIVLGADGTGSEGFPILFQWQRKEGETFVDIAGATTIDFSIPRATLDWDGTVVRMAVRTEGAEAFSDEATITVVPETTPPQLIRVSGLEERIVAQFSEPLDPDSALDAAHYSASGEGAPLDILELTLLPNERTVILTTAPQTVGTKYSVSVTGIIDQAASPNQLADTEARFYSLGGLLPQDENGLLVFEAEAYTENTDNLWMDDSLWGTPSGGISVVLPNGAGGNEDSKLNYTLSFTRTGEHIMWYRASGPSGTDDSGWLHVDGGRPPDRVDANLASMTGFADTSDFVWRSQPQEGGGQMTFTIDEAGEHVIGLARREDGSYFDKFVITTDPDFDPTQFGAFGPPETREGTPPLPEMTLSVPDFIPPGGPVEFTPEISDTVRVISRVEYFADGNPIGESSEAPFTFRWQNPAAGTYQITSVLTDDVGQSVQAAPIDVTVSEGGGEPSEIAEIVSIERTGAGILIRFAAGQSYDVEHSPDVNSPAWSVIATDVSDLFEDTDPVRVGESEGYYRGVQAVEEPQ